MLKLQREVETGVCITFLTTVTKHLTRSNLGTAGLPWAHSLRIQPNRAGKVRQERCVSSLLSLDQKQSPDRKLGMALKYGGPPPVSHAL